MPLKGAPDASTPDRAAYLTDRQTTEIHAQLPGRDGDSTWILMAKLCLPSPIFHLFVIDREYLHL